MYAAGSYARSVYVYEESTGEAVFELSDLPGGVTHLQFNRRGNLLLSGARKDASVYVWDIRTTRDILYELPRASDTNQRIYFDVDPSDRFVVTVFHH